MVVGREELDWRKTKKAWFWMMWKDFWKLTGNRVFSPQRFLHQTLGLGGRSVSSKSFKDHKRTYEYIWHKRVIRITDARSNSGIRERKNQKVNHQRYHLEGKFYNKLSKYTSLFCSSKKVSWYTYHLDILTLNESTISQVANITTFFHLRKSSSQLLSMTSSRPAPHLAEIRCFSQRNGWNSLY